MGMWSIISLLKKTGKRLSNKEIEKRIGKWDVSSQTYRLFCDGILDREWDYAHYVYFLRGDVTEGQLEKYRFREVRDICITVKCPICNEKVSEPFKKKRTFWAWQLKHFHDWHLPIDKHMQSHGYHYVNCTDCFLLYEIGSLLYDWRNPRSWSNVRFAERISPISHFRRPVLSRWAMDRILSLDRFPKRKIAKLPTVTVPQYDIPIVAPFFDGTLFERVREQIERELFLELLESRVGKEQREIYEEWLAGKGYINIAMDHDRSTEFVKKMIAQIHIPLVDGWLEEEVEKVI